jgi:hypothetical protein
LRPVVVDFLATLFVTFCIGVGTAVVLAACVVLMAGDARGADAPGLAAMKASEAGQGTLLFKADTTGETFAAPLLATDVVIKVSGLVARAQVKQTFRNPRDDWYEGVYVFPLPENSAVDRLRMTIGERIIEGAIRERREERLRAGEEPGRRAALLEQERPNIFTSSVANIGPREDIVVEIEYQQTLRYDAGTFSLRFPMTVGARYIPGAPLAGSTGTGWYADTTRVSDASRITPPVLHPSKGPINPVSIRVELDAGVPLARIDSPYHGVTLRSDGHRRDIVELEAGVTPANRDFELAWTPASKPEPRTAWFTEKRGGKTYGLLMILPPDAATGGKRIPRESILVIDTSGSMSGTSIAQAKEALLLAIDGLSPEDSFNIIEFNSYARPLFKARAPHARAPRRSARLGRGLRAQGGRDGACPQSRTDWRRAAAHPPGRASPTDKSETRTSSSPIRASSGTPGSSRSASVPRRTAIHDEGGGHRARHLHLHRQGREVREKWRRSSPARVPVLKGGESTGLAPARKPGPRASPTLTPASRCRHHCPRPGYGRARVRCAAPCLGRDLPRSAGGRVGPGAFWARDKVSSSARCAKRRPPGDPGEHHRACADHQRSQVHEPVAIDRLPRPAHADLKNAALPVNLPEAGTTRRCSARSRPTALAGRLRKAPPIAASTCSPGRSLCSSRPCSSGSRGPSGALRERQHSDNSPDACMPGTIPVRCAAKRQVVMSAMVFQ